MVLGHESWGVVTGIGPNVAEGRFKIGDRVALEVGFPCRECPLCRQGRYNICSRLRFRSSAKTFPHLDGTLVELTNHPAELCHPLPSTVSDVGGALLEPLAVCLHGIRRSKPPTKEEVELTKAAGGHGEKETAALVFGAGAVGLLLAAALATSENFTSIVVADIDAGRLGITKALNLGLKTVLIPQNPLGKDKSAATPPPADAPHAEQVAYALQTAQGLATILKESAGALHGFSRVYDCTGVPACVQAGIYAAAAGGTLVQIGMGNPVQTLPIGAAALREVDIIGVFRYDGQAYPAAIALMASGKLSCVEEKVVTHWLKLEEGNRAFTLAGKGVDEEGKPVVKVVIEA